MASSIRPWHDLGQAYRDLYDDPWTLIEFPPYAISREGKLIVEWGECKCRICNRTYESGATAIRRHLRTFHKKEVERAKPGNGRASQIPQYKAFYSAMNRYHQGYRHYLRYGGIKPRFNTAGPEELQFWGKQCTGSSDDENLPRCAKRKRSAEGEAQDKSSSSHDERKKRRASSEAKGFVLGDEEVYPCDPAMDSNDEPIRPNYDNGPTSSANPRPSPELWTKSDDEREEREGGCQFYFFVRGKRRRIGTTCVWLEKPRKSSPGPASIPPDMIDEPNKTPSDDAHARSVEGSHSEVDSREQSESCKSNQQQQPELHETAAIHKT